MTGSRQVPLGARACPFCGMATLVPHETQEACIAALHEEIGRTKTILASLKPAWDQASPAAAAAGDDEEAEEKDPSARSVTTDPEYL